MSEQLPERPQSSPAPSGGTGEREGASRKDPYEPTRTRAAEAFADHELEVGVDVGIGPQADARQSDSPPAPSEDDWPPACTKCGAPSEYDTVAHGPLCGPCCGVVAEPKAKAPVAGSGLEERLIEAQERLIDCLGRIQIAPDRAYRKEMQTQAVLARDDVNSLRAAFAAQRPKEPVAGSGLVALEPWRVACPGCMGEGTVENYSCNRCGGEGTVEVVAANAAPLSVALDDVVEALRAYDFGGNSDGEIYSAAEDFSPDDAADFLLSEFASPGADDV